MKKMFAGRFVRKLKGVTTIMHCQVSSLNKILIIREYKVILVARKILILCKLYYLCFYSKSIQIFCDMQHDYLYMLL